MDVSSLLKDVIAYVEVRSSNDNRSAAIYKELESMGAQTRPTFTNDVTHVVFKEGTRRTWNKARKLNVPLVSVTWLESCRRNNMQVPPKDFPAIVPEEISSPLPKFNQGPRWKKMKSMQPCDFDEELARSAERGERKRKREMMANRFKITDDSSPVASSPRSILALDTQARSPCALPSLLSYYSPVPDTPSSLKERLEKMLREQREVLEMDGEPEVSTPSLQHVEKPQQRRLFECNLTSSSSDENVLTSRLVQGVIKSLESDSESPQFNELTKRNLPANALSPTSSSIHNSKYSPKSNFEVTPSRKTRLSLKSPHRNSVCTIRTANNIENGMQASEFMSDRNKQSLKPLSPQDLNLQAATVNPFTGATSVDNSKVVSLKDYKVNPTVSSMSSLLSNGSSGDHALAFKELAGVGKTLEGDQRRSSNFKSRRQSKVSSVFQNDDHDVDVRRKTESAEPMCKNPPLQPKSTRKRHLFSKCQANPLLDESSTDSQDILPKMPFSSKEQMDDSLSSAKADASFLFSIGGPKNGNVLKTKQVNHARKGSKKKSSPDSDVSLSSESCSQEKPCSQLAASSCTQDDSAMKTQLESSMSVMYPSEVSQVNGRPSRRTSVRLSINEFSFKNSFMKKASKSKSMLSQPEINKESTAEKSQSISSACPTSVEARKHSGAKRKRSRSSSGAKVSEEYCKRQKKSKSTSTEEKVDLNTSSAADNEKGTSSKLRHARSLILANPDMLLKKDKYSLVMTSLHREEQDVVCSAVKRFGVFCMTRNVEACTTHVVCGDARRTLNILRAIARGCWVLRKDWVLESLEDGNWLLEEKYEMGEEFPSAKESRLRREKAGQGYKPAIFSKTGPIFVYRECTPPRDELVHLINLCCGSVTGSQTRAAIFIGDNHDPKRLVIHPTWILDSIMRLETLNPADYIVPSPVSASQREASPEF